MAMSKTDKTLRYKLSLFVNNVSKSLFKDEFYLRKKVKPLLMVALKFKYAKGFPVKIGGKVECLLDPTFYFANWENFGGGHNSGFEECVNEASQSKVFFDVGGHIGLYSIPIAKLQNDNGVVHTFEPASHNYKMLKKHVALNSLKNVSLNNVLVGAEANDNVAFKEDSTGINPMNSLADVDKTEGNDIISKKMIKLDEYCKENQIYPNVMKIDVEGAEVQVLKGAMEVIKKSSPTIYLSLHPKHIVSLGDSMSDITDILNEVGYKCTTIDGRDNSDFHDKEALLTLI